MINFTTHPIKVLIFSCMFLLHIGAFAQPLITLNGNSTIYVERKSTYTSLGATAYDTIDGKLTDSIKVASDVTTDENGIYSETYSVTNSRGQTASVIRLVIVKNDLTPPALNLYGPDTIYIEAAKDNPYFNDPGATATDNWFPFNMSSSIIVSGEVNTRRLGLYILSYTVSDIAGNQSSAQRTVIVRDTRAPEWLDKTSPLYLELSKPFVDPVKISDAYDDVIMIQVSYPVTGPVDVNKVGQYDYIYTAADSSGNAADTLFISYIVKENLSVTDTRSFIFSIYPCPAKDMLYIDLQLSSQPVSIKLYTADGRLVSGHASQEDNTHFSFNLAGLTQGIYFLDIEIGGKTYREKIIRE
jgi:hypothetical protein